MRSYVIESKDQDISFIPVNSFVYLNGCGFIKRNETTLTWNDADFEKVVCSGNNELNPSIPNPEEAVEIKEAEYFKVVVEGAFDFEKGATITEIDFIDFEDKIIPWDKNDITDKDLAVEDYWDSEDWGVANLYNGVTDYKIPEDGPKSSTLFNYGEGNDTKTSTFWIQLPEEKVQMIQSINVVVGSPDGRIPKSLKIYAVINKDDDQTRQETLIYYKTFKNEIDGNSPATLTKATQTLGSDPCYDLFMNGMNTSGSYLIMNPLTGKLEPIYCDFPPLIKALSKDDPAYENFMTELCSQSKNAVVIIENPDGTYSKLTLAEYFDREGWICECSNCDGKFGNDQLKCFISMCQLAKINPNATTTLINEETFEVTKVKVTDYLSANGVDCEELALLDPDSLDGTVSSITSGSFDKNGLPILSDEFSALLSKLDANNTLAYFNLTGFDTSTFNYQPSDGVVIMDPETGVREVIPTSVIETTLLAALEGPSTVVLEPGEVFEDPGIKIIRADGEVQVDKEGEVNSEVPGDYKITYTITDGKSTVTLVRTISIIEDKEEYVEQAVESSPVVYPSIDGNDNPTEVSDFVVPADVNEKNIVVFSSNPDIEINYHFEIEEVLETVYELEDPNDPNSPLIPKLDEDGKPIQEPIKKIKLIVDSINVPNPDTFDYKDADFFISINGYSQKLDFTIKPPKFLIEDARSTQGFFSKELKQLDTYYFIKKMEIDEASILIRYYGAKETPTLKISDKFESIVKPFAPDNGIIYIKPKFTKDDFEHLYEEEVFLSDGEETYTIKLFIMYHMRIYDFNNKIDYHHLDHILMTGEADEIIPLYANAKPYIFNYRGRASFDKISAGRATYYLDGVKYWTREAENKDDGRDYELVFRPIDQRLRDNKYYLIDPFFNAPNRDANLIDTEDIYEIVIELQTNKRLEPSTNKLVIDKYRFMNSKNNFGKNFSSTFFQYQRDFKIQFQDPGLNIQLMDPKVCGVAIAGKRPMEDAYFTAWHGGLKTMVFKILTDDRFTMGKTQMLISDVNSTRVIDVEVFQQLDIPLTWDKDRYTIGGIVNLTAGDSLKDIPLLHPYLDNYDSIKAYSNEFGAFDFEFSEDKKTVTITPNKIGVHYCYLADDRVHHKIEIEAQFERQFTPEYRKYQILDNETEPFEIRLLYSEGTVEIVDYDDSLFNVELIETENGPDSSYSAKITYVGGLGNFQTSEIKFIDKTDAGDREAILPIQILDSTKYYVPGYDLGEDGSVNANDLMGTDYKIVNLSDDLSYDPETGLITFNSSYSNDLSSQQGTITIEDSEGNQQTITISYIPEWDLDVSTIVFDMEEEDDDNL